MGICTRRNFLLSICILQLVSTIERQVFDFLGFLWAPILANFFHVIFVIFGFFGAFQYRPRYIIAYVTWCIIWIGWNVFLICFYLSIGALNKDSDVLNLGTGTVSWFEVNGYGCRPMFPTNLTVPIEKDPFRPIRPEKVNSCLMDYEYVEVLHSSIQCALAIMGGIAGIFLSQIFLEEDDSFDFITGVSKSPQHMALHPMYVKDYNPLYQQAENSHRSYNSCGKLMTGPTNRSKPARSHPKQYADRIRSYNSETNIQISSAQLASLRKHAKIRPMSLYAPRPASQYV